MHEQKVDREAFERVARQLEQENMYLTFDMIGSVFGRDFYNLLIWTLMPTSTYQKDAELIRLAQQAGANHETR